MSKNIICIKELDSGKKAIAHEVSNSVLALEVGSGIIFLHADEIYQFIRLTLEADLHFLKKEAT